MGGNLQSAVSAAVSGGISGGINIGFSDASLPLRLGAKMATSAAISYVSGGDWRRAALFAGGSELGRAGWEYAKEETDRLYLASCTRAGNCGSDSSGWKTDGGRNIKPGFKDGEEDRIPGVVNSYLGGGMSGEGAQHIYSTGSSFCNATGSLLCGAIRGFVRQVSKPHDWGNSWGYDKDPLSGTYGDRIQGGGFSSLAARVSYEVGVQTWSFASMPVMAGFTGVSLYGDYFNPNIYGRRR